MELKDNELNLTPITKNELFIDPDNTDTAYIYTDDGNSGTFIHMRGKKIFKELPVGCFVEVVYMHPNHLFLLKIDKKRDDGYCHTISKVGDKPCDKYHTSLKINRLAKDIKLKPQMAKQKGAKNSGVKDKYIVPYKCYKAIGWLMNIEEFQPEKPSIS